jgi:hypothetical protein
MLIAEAPARSADAEGLARFNRSLELIHTIDEAIQRMVSVRVELDEGHLV